MQNKMKMVLCLINMLTVLGYCSTSTITATECETITLTPSTTTVTLISVNATSTTTLYPEISPAAVTTTTDTSVFSYITNTTVPTSSTAVMANATNLYPSNSTLTSTPTSASICTGPNNLIYDCASASGYNTTAPIRGTVTSTYVANATSATTTGGFPGYSGAVATTLGSGGSKARGVCDKKGASALLIVRIMGAAVIAGGVIGFGDSLC